MADFWSKAAYRTNANASVVQAPPSSGLCVRLRSLQLSADNRIVQVMDGATQVWAAHIMKGTWGESCLDVRSSAGNSLTIQHTGAVNQDTSVSAQGDFCYPGAGYLSE
jgi:hypothetical protein